MAKIPRLVDLGVVEHVIVCCDAASTQGVRDRAVLLLVARLGLRSAEVANLTLDDIDWGVGEIIVRGKARREDRLPLPADIGQALSDYLALRGPHPSSRRVFFPCRAPICPIKPALVNHVTRRACRHVGIGEFGPNRMRHALAGQLLRRGAGLTAISQVLRHQDLTITAATARDGNACGL